MLLLFAIMFVYIFITAKIFGRTLNPVKERTGLIMELPPYHKPRWGAMFRMTLNRVWEVFKKAFAVVFIVSVIFYFMSYSSDGNVEGSFLYLTTPDSLNKFPSINIPTNGVVSESV